MKANTVLLIVLFTTCFAPPGVAEHDDHHPLSEAGHDHGGAHVHGAATVQLAFEGEVLDIRVLTPSVNLLGFEGTAASEEQRDKTRAVRDVLGQPEELFVIEGTRCTVQRDHTVVSGLDDNAGSHDDHDADHDHDDHHEGDHSDIEAQYRFSCVEPERAESVRLPILSRFPGIERADVQWIARGKQGAVTLQGGNQEVLFR